MTSEEIRETLRQMLADWNAATEEQRKESLRIAAERIERLEADVEQGTYGGLDSGL